MAERLNPTRNYSRAQLIEGLSSWASMERDRAADARGYGSSDRGTYRYRADLLETAIAAITRSKQ